MAGRDNADQIAFWNGPAGETWARNQDRIDRGFAPLTAALLRRADARPGESVLDVGCGCGDTTLKVAMTLGATGRVLAVDVSGPMLALAKERATRRREGVYAPIEWALDDASARAFAAGAADLVLSRFGVMFFADPTAAFANLRRAVRPGGRLAMMCWRGLDENAWFNVPREAVLPLVPPPEPMPADAPGPFAFADPARVTSILAGAGFQGIEARRFDAMLTLGEGDSDAEAVARAVVFSVNIGPARSLLREVSPDIVTEAEVAMATALLPHVRDGKVSLGAACWLYTATN